MKSAKVIEGRLIALRTAIESGSAEEARFHYNNMVRGITELLVEHQRVAAEAEWEWEPLERAVAKGLSPADEEMLRARGADDAMIAEMTNAEIHKNSLYTVTVTRHAEGFVEELSIRRNDRRPVHDWRHFQMIKTQLAGAEVEAFEMYPRESRLMDTANQYYVFCLPEGMSLPAGYDGPRNLWDVDDHTESNAEQRKLPNGWTSTFKDLFPTVS